VAEQDAYSQDDRSSRVALLERSPDFAETVARLYVVNEHTPTVPTPKTQSALMVVSKDIWLQPQRRMFDQYAQKRKGFRSIFTRELRCRG
jgi:hypothetical protein